MFSLKKFWHLTGQPLNNVPRGTLKEPMQLELQRANALKLDSIYKYGKMSAIFKNKVAANEKL